MIIRKKIEMKSNRTLIYIAFLFLLLSACNHKANQKEIQPQPEVENRKLSFLSSSDTLIFSFTDEKCGEWGGETRSIYIYKIISKSSEHEVLVDLTEYHMDCDSIVPEAEPKVGFRKDKIRINNEDVGLIIEAMEEYFVLKLNFEEDIPVMSNSAGCFSGITTKKKKMYMTLYPSPKWKTFDLLFEKLKNNTQ